MARIDYSRLDLASIPETEELPRRIITQPTDPEEQPEVIEQPLLLRTSEAATLLGVGRTNLYRLINDGHLRSIKIYGRRLVPREALTEFVNNTKEAA